MTRKPNLKDKIYGCIAFTKDMIVGILTFNIPRIQLDWCLICETIKGNYEIVEKQYDTFRKSFDESKRTLQ